jgi:molecular chaperone DnaK
MIREAEQHAAEDKRRREVIEARNHADALLHTTEKSLTEAGDRLGDRDRLAVERAIADLRSAMTSDNPASIRQRSDELAQAAARLAAAMPQSDNAGSTPGGQASGDSDDGVVDAEFEEANEGGRRGV